MLETPSPTGSESRGQKLWMEAARSVADTVECDAYGNAWAILNGSLAQGPRVMITAHGDEIGFTIRHITEKGFLTLGPIGGSDVAIARGRRITILGDKGDVPGVIGNTAIHLRKKPDERVPAWEELYVDVGCRSRQEVRDRGLRVGQMAVYAEPPFELAPGLLVGRALDNRIGGWILLRVLQELCREELRPNAKIIALNTVQEEIGGNGARMAGHRLRPDLAIVLDVTHATDAPGIDVNQHGEVKLGEGPVLTHGTANHPGLVRQLMNAAQASQIAIQHEASNPRGTSTDTDDIFWLHSGIPSALVAVPLRSMHSPVEVACLADAEMCARLLVSFLRSLGSREQIMAEIL